MSQLTRINTETIEDFSVVDSDGLPLAGITLTEFTHDLFNPSGNSSAQVVVFSELGSGHYRVKFTPNAKGVWYLVVYHSNYFPGGKGANISVYDEDIDSVALLVHAIKDIEYGRWLLSGNQMIFYKEDNTTEVARFNITRDADLVPIERVKI